MVCDPDGPIQPLFDLDVRGPNRVVNLIELSRMRNGEVVAQAPNGLETQAPAQLPVGRRGPMQISGLCRSHREAAIKVDIHTWSDSKNGHGLLNQFSI